jgi:hypothetical protein
MSSFAPPQKFLAMVFCFTIAQKQGASNCGLKPDTVSQKKKRLPPFKLFLSDILQQKWKVDKQ